MDGVRLLFVSFYILHKQLITCFFFVLFFEHARIKKETINLGTEGKRRETGGLVKLLSTMTDPGGQNLTRLKFREGEDGR